MSSSVLLSAALCHHTTSCCAVTCRAGTQSLLQQAKSGPCRAMSCFGAPSHLRYSAPPSCLQTLQQAKESESFTQGRRQGREAVEGAKQAVVQVGGGGGRRHEWAGGLFVHGSAWVGLRVRLAPSQGISCLYDVGGRVGGLSWYGHHPMPHSCSGAHASHCFPHHTMPCTLGLSPRGPPGKL